MSGLSQGFIPNESPTEVTEGEGQGNSAGIRYFLDQTTQLEDNRVMTGGCEKKQELKYGEAGVRVKRSKTKRSRKQNWEYWNDHYLARYSEHFLRWMTFLFQVIHGSVLLTDCM